MASRHRAVWQYLVNGCEERLWSNSIAIVHTESDVLCDTVDFSYTNTDADAINNVDAEHIGLAATDTHRYTKWYADAISGRYLVFNAVSNGFQ
jgi:hypothetical protein